MAISTFPPNQTNPKITLTMPRFADAHVALLKRTMLARAPAYLFTDEDIQLITGDTGLDAAQIQQWGRNFRLRYQPEERDEALRNLAPDQVCCVRL